MTDDDNGDAEIRELVARQFASMSWPPGGGPDWISFRDDFLPDAKLYASRRPVEPHSLDQFIRRMDGLVGTRLASFSEKVLATKIVSFGNVAVAVVTCENTENATDIDRNVEMMLLVRAEGRWKIAAQAWDKETLDRPIPASLLSGGG